MTASYQQPPLPSAPDQEARCIGNVVIRSTDNEAEAREWTARLRGELFTEHSDAYTALRNITVSGGAFSIPAFAAELGKVSGLDAATVSAHVTSYTDPQKAAGFAGDFDEGLQELEKAAAQRRKILSGMRMVEDGRDGVGLDLIKSARAPLLTFLTPNQILNWKAAPDHYLVGEALIARGELTLIAGAPGIGKSRTATALAVSGATGRDWLGQRVRCRFRTLFIQCENGMHRLHADFAALKAAGVDLEGVVEVLAPPDVGLAFGRAEFRAEVLDACERLQDGKHPLMVVIDPWTECTEGDDKAGYQNALKHIRASLPKGDDAPALVIVCHTRKPKDEERSAGRSLLNCISGSYSIASAARAAFVLAKVTDEADDPRRVWSCAKANNCEMPAATVWTCEDAGFEVVQDFDWAEWRVGTTKPAGRPPKVTEAHVREALAETIIITRRGLALKLMDLAKCVQSKAYDAVTRYTESGLLTQDGDDYRLAS